MSASTTAPQTKEERPHSEEDKLQLRLEVLLAREEELEAWEAQREELLKGRRKRHSCLSQHLPPGSRDVVKRQVKALMKRLHCWVHPPPGTAGPPPDTGGAIAAARQSVLGEPVRADTDSERE